MFDLPAALIRIEAIIEISDAALPLAERRRLRAETKQLMRQIDSHIEGPLGGDDYALEKTGTVEGHIAAALGLGDTNGWGSKEHRSWALGDFWNLKSRLTAVA